MESDPYQTPNSNLEPTKIVKLKKPPSHIVAIILYILFVTVGLFQAQHSMTKFNAPLYVVVIFPLIFSIGLYGIVRVRKWSRIICSIPIGFFIAMPFLNKSNPDQLYPTLFLGIFVAGLLSWWLYSFTFGEFSKEYFKNKNS